MNRIHYLEFHLRLTFSIVYLSFKRLWFIVEGHIWTCRSLNSSVTWWVAVSWTIMPRLLFLPKHNQITYIKLCFQNFHVSVIVRNLQIPDNTIHNQGEKHFYGSKYIAYYTKNKYKTFVYINAQYIHTYIHFYFLMHLLKYLYFQF